MARLLPALAPVLLISLVALAGCGGGSHQEGLPATGTVTLTDDPTQESTPSSTPAEVDLTQPPTTLEQAEAHLAAATDTVQTKRFFAHGQTFYCSLKSSFFDGACELGQGAMEDSAYCGENAGSTAIGRIEIAKGEVTPVCNSDTIRTGTTKTVPDGTLVQPSGSAVACLVEKIGVTCVNADAGVGFFLTPGQYVTFPS